MKKNLFEIEDVDHMYRLYLVAQIGSIHDVEDCFEAIPARFLTERVYNQLIAFYIRKDMLKNAEIVLEKLKSSLDIISVRPYNQFMSMYRHQGHIKKAFELIEAMNGSQTSPDTRTYNLLLSLISKQGDPDGVLKSYKTMKDEGVAPNIVTYSLVAKAYVSVGRLEEALTVAMEMKKLKGRNAHLAHDLRLAVYAEQGKYDDLRKLWKEVERSRNLAARSYGIMIESLGKLGYVKEAERLAAKAARKKMKFPGKVYNALMDVYGRHGMIEAAERLMGQISSANSVTYKHLISGYLKQDQLDKALEYLRTSRNSLTYSNSKPWFQSLMLIMENLAERGEYEIAEHAFRYFTSPGSHRNTSIYNELIKAYIKARKATPSLSFQQRMFADGLEPDAKTMALLVELESLHETING
jgi:pentatricopeptide repeat protein